MKLSMKNTKWAFSLTELLVCIVALAILISLGLIGFRQLKPRMASISCESRLKEIGLAFRLFAADHNGSFPVPLEAAQGITLSVPSESDLLPKYFRALEGILPTPDRLVCPQDGRLPARGWNQLSTTNLSYFLGVDAKAGVPLSILAGDRNIITNAPRLVASVVGIQWEKSVGLHGDVGNVLFADGHVDRLTSLGLSNALQQAGNLSNRLAVP